MQRCAYIKIHRSIILYEIPVNTVIITHIQIRCSLKKGGLCDKLTAVQSLIQSKNTDTGVCVVESDLIIIGLLSFVFDIQIL